MGAWPVELDPHALLPAQWLREARGQDVRVYNPALTRYRGRLLVAYRVDSWERAQCRIAVCALDDHLQVAQNSASNFSDTVRDGGAWHYDPRFLIYRDRLFIHYNNNFRTSPNRIFLVEVDPDTLAARSPARPLHLNGPRQEIEKNWMFFEHDGDLFAVYRIAPHTILRVNLDGAGPIECNPVHATTWDVSAYAERFGLPCGGTPPVRTGGAYLSFFHSRRPISPLRWVLRYWPVVPDANWWRQAAAVRTTAGRLLVKLERRLRHAIAQVRYYAGAYAFAAAPPFRPLWLTSEPVLRPEEERPAEQRVRANPYASGIVYPCGAIPWDDGSWLVSYGVQDERCCLRSVRLPALDQIS
jgi:hypothetical protein